MKINKNIFITVDCIVMIYGILVWILTKIIENGFWKYFSPNGLFFGFAYFYTGIKIILGFIFLIKGIVKHNFHFYKIYLFLIIPTIISIIYFSFNKYYEMVLIIFGLIVSFPWLFIWFNYFKKIKWNNILFSILTPISIIVFNFAWTYLMNI
ncbi:hypothetical protein FACS1894172_17880 [Spirochaetia bacterium]|nr:hypothetical protein FACS1894164_15110 [Spirochaetia bacterium]GHU35720.1 hypothetical protein FACS1894172_17880 [Spirochaetia bacterium]